MPQLRRIGRSIETPPLILGGNVFGWTADRETSFAVLDAFVSGGGRMIDTADAYSAWVSGHKGGESETLIGEWLRRRGRREDVLIATKVGKLPGGGGEGLAPARIAAAARESLERLGTDYIDLYFAHADDPHQDLGAVAEAFDALVRAGRVREIGASNFTRDRLAAALDAQEEKGAAHYAALQNQYNLLERDDYEGGMQALCVERGIAMTPYYGLASGYLTGKYRRPEDLAGKTRGGAAKRYMQGKGPRVLAAMDRVAEETGASLAQIALAWSAAQPGVAAPIASATSVEQVDELLGAMELRLTDEQITLLDRACAPGEAAEAS
ncbi:MAG TPA: aldo/keto reductase [Sphingomonas sp.]|nr:aldo/keto reductase [Sphingomonas sp.]